MDCLYCNDSYIKRMQQLYLVVEPEGETILLCEECIVALKEHHPLVPDTKIFEIGEDITHFFL